MQERIDFRCSIAEKRILDAYCEQTRRSKSDVLREKIRELKKELVQELDKRIEFQDLDFETMPLKDLRNFILLCRDNIEAFNAYTRRIKPAQEFGADD